MDAEPCMWFHNSIGLCMQYSQFDLLCASVTHSFFASLLAQSFSIYPFQPVPLFTYFAPFLPPRSQTFLAPWHQTHCFVCHWHQGAGYIIKPICITVLLFHTNWVIPLACTSWKTPTRTPLYSTSLFIISAVNVQSYINLNWFQYVVMRGWVQVWGWTVWAIQALTKCVSIPTCWLSMLFHTASRLLVRAS